MHNQKWVHTPHTDSSITAQLDIEFEGSLEYMKLSQKQTKLYHFAS